MQGYPFGNICVGMGNRLNHRVPTKTFVKLDRTSNTFLVGIDCEKKLNKNFLLNVKPDFFPWHNLVIYPIKTSLCQTINLIQQTA